MPTDWLKKRYDGYVKRTSDEAARRAWDANAINSSGSKFYELKGRVKADVGEHNSMFPDQLTFGSRDADSFFVSEHFDTSALDVEAQFRSVQVSKPAHGTVIQIKHRVGNRITRPDQLEVVANERAYLFQV